MTPEEPDLSHHARQRKQQRAVPQIGVWALLEFGASEPAGGGCSRLFFDHQTWKKVQRFFGNWPLKSMDRLKDLYLIVGGDGVVVTVAYRE
ncbi:MAG TPA: hypothetical protein VGO52_06640 [Hyphomonadaceae bacterium]|jgi:hypothetical protein|nr:hypothetical protein [Hyphomonadaceae bacterium]